jgi:hypothetical protein
MWNRAENQAPWDGRYGHTSVIDAAGAIYVLGGKGGTFTLYQDVWVSTNGGADWTRAGSTRGIRMVARGGTRRALVGPFWILDGTLGAFWVLGRYLGGTQMMLTGYLPHSRGTEAVLKRVLKRYSAQSTEHVLSCYSAGSERVLLLGVYAKYYRGILGHYRHSRGSAAYSGVPSGPMVPLGDSGGILGAR